MANILDSSTIVSRDVDEKHDYEYVVSKTILAYLLLWLRDVKKLRETLYYRLDVHVHQGHAVVRPVCHDGHQGQVAIYLSQHDGLIRVVEHQTTLCCLTGNLVF